MRFRAHIDGAARGNPGPAGAGVFVEAEDGLPAEEHFEALGRQTSPLVQISLIAFFAETNGPGSADVLRRLSQDQMVDQAVRARAALAAQRVG